MIWVIIGVIYSAILNYFGLKAVWISFGCGLLLSIISGGSLVTLGVILVFPAILRVLFTEILMPFFHIWWNDVKSR